MVFKPLKQYLESSLSTNHYQVSAGQDCLTVVCLFVTWWVTRSGAPALVGSMTARDNRATVSDPAPSEKPSPPVVGVVKAAAMTTRAAR